MPKRTCIPSILIIGASFALPASTNAAVETRPDHYQLDGWSTTCEPSNDGFVARCVAHKPAGPYLLRLSVGDGQFFQFVEHPSCSVESHNVFRDELFSLSRRERRRWVVSNFEQLTRRLAANCPELVPLERKAFRNPPDVAMAGEDELR